MARVIVKEPICLGKKFFDGVMTFKDVVDMISKIDVVEFGIRVSKATYSNKFTHNIHHIHFYAGNVDYEIHLTEKQFKQMKPKFEEMGEIKISEFFWWHHRF